jgi:hypothetical protein
MNALQMGSPPRNGEAPELHQQSEAPKQTTAPTFSSESLPQVNFAYPSLTFLPGRVLGVLLTGERITHKDSWLKFGHARLADSTWKLRKLGWPIRIVEELVSTSDAGRKAAIGIYFLEAETIAQAGEVGQLYAEQAAAIERDRRVA